MLQQSTRALFAHTPIVVQCVGFSLSDFVGLANPGERFCRAVDVAVKYTKNYLL